MLILTRKVGEAMLIGDDVTITLLSVKGNQVRLGIDAPRSTTVYREEIYHRQKKTGQPTGFKKAPKFLQQQNEEEDDNRGNR